MTGRRARLVRRLATQLPRSVWMPYPLVTYRNTYEQRRLLQDYREGRAR